MAGDQGSGLVGTPPVLFSSMRSALRCLWSRWVDVVQTRLERLLPKTRSRVHMVVASALVEDCRSLSVSGGAAWTVMSLVDGFVLD